MLDPGNLPWTSFKRLTVLLSWILLRFVLDVSIVHFSLRIVATPLHDPFTSGEATLLISICTTFPAAHDNLALPTFFSLAGSSNPLPTRNLRPKASTAGTLPRRTLPCQKPNPKPATNPLKKTKNDERSPRFFFQSGF